jgi:hypothetical protein
MKTLDRAIQRLQQPNALSTKANLLDAIEDALIDLYTLRNDLNRVSDERVAELERKISERAQ